MVSSRSRWPSSIWMVRRSAPASSRCVAKQCLSVCGCTCFLQARSLGGFLASVPDHFGGNRLYHRYASGCLETAMRLAFALIRASAHAVLSSSFGLSMTSRSLRPLPPWT